MSTSAPRNRIPLELRSFPRSHSGAYLVRCVFEFEGVLAIGRVICLAPSMRVAAERVRNRFRHRHRPRWRRHSLSPGSDRLRSIRSLAF